MRGSMPRPGDDVNHVDNRGYSALMLAAAKGQEEIVSILLENDVSVNQFTVVDNCYRSALLEAISHRRTEVVRILLQNGADVNQGVPESLAGNPELLYTPLQVAIEDANGDSDIVSVLIENHANVNLFSVFGDLAPLGVAARCASASLVSKLIRAGAHVNLILDARGSTALMRAASAPHSDDWNDSIRLYQSHLATISLLLHAGADVNAVSNDGRTALLNAIRSGERDAVLVLIANGANVNQRTALGTPLMRAIETRNSSMIRILFLSGAETRSLPEDLFEKFIRPIMRSLEGLVTRQTSLITTAFVEMKNGNQKDDMLKNSAFREIFDKWDDLRIDMVSRIISFLATLQSEDLPFSFIIAPFLVNADMERLNKFGIVLSFLTSPQANKTNKFRGTNKAELVQFIEETFRYAIVVGCFGPFPEDFEESFSFVVDSMYAVYLDVDAEMGALNQALRIIPDNFETVLHFRLGQFGIYSKFASRLVQELSVVGDSDDESENNEI